MHGIGLAVSKSAFCCVIQILTLKPNSAMFKIIVKPLNICKGLI